MSEDTNFSPDMNRTFKKEKDPLNKYFDWDSAPKFLEKYKENASMKSFAEDVIRYLSMTVSEQKHLLRNNVNMIAYKQHYQELKNTFPKLNANPTGLTIDQILAQDRHFVRKYVENNVGAQILASMPGCTRVLDGKKWEIKHHKLTQFEWPLFTKTFKNLGVVNVGPEGVKSEGMGWGMQYEIPFTTLDQAAGGIFDIDYWHVFFLAERMGIFGDQRIFLGGAGTNTSDRGAPNLKGLHNSKFTAATPYPGSGGSVDDDFTAGLADWNDAYETMLTAYRTTKLFAKPSRNILVTSSGLASEMFINDSTVGALKTLYQQIQDKWYRSNNQMDQWWVSQHLFNGASSAANQQIMTLKLSPSYIKRTIVYPLQRKAILDKRYSDDVAFAYITGDILQIYESSCILKQSTLATASLDGWVESGLFMTATTSGQQVRTSGRET